MARTKPLEEDEPINFARGVLDKLIAKHDPEAIREQGKDPAKVASGVGGFAKLAIHLNSLLLVSSSN